MSHSNNNKHTKHTKINILKKRTIFRIIMIGIADQLKSSISLTLNLSTKK